MKKPAEYEVISFAVFAVACIVAFLQWHGITTWYGALGTGVSAVLLMVNIVRYVLLGSENNNSDLDLLHMVILFVLLGILLAGWFVPVNYG